MGEKNDREDRESSSRGLNLGLAQYEGVLTTGLRRSTLTVITSLLII
jgi:hypothetical protein